MRLTPEMPLETALNLIEAHDYAQQLGRPLNHLVTVHWAKADGGGEAQRRWARLQICLRRWCERRGFPLTLVWAHERNLSKSLHTHALLHLPRGRAAEFGRTLPRWIGGELQAGVMDIRPADERAILYLAKDVNPVHYGDLHLPKGWVRKRSTRRVHGKRAGVSQNLGPKARIPASQEQRNAA